MSRETTWEDLVDGHMQTHLYHLQKFPKEYQACIERLQAQADRINAELTRVYRIRWSKEEK